MGERGIRQRRNLLALAALLGLAAGQLGAHLRIEPLATWSYDLSWWSYILLADAVVHARTGSTFVHGRPSALPALALWSAVYWLAHEALNLRLANWYYVGIPGDLATRTVGVFVSFATVLPGVLVTERLLWALGLFRGARGRPFALTRGLRRALALSGLACLVLPLALPRICFPLVWGAAPLLCEAWLSGRGGRGLLRRLSSGERGTLLRVLVAGAACGLLWEAWNWKSPARWIYTVPGFEASDRLFEMPWLGFIGFLPFALGCHAFAAVLVECRLVPDRESRPAPLRARYPLFAAAGLAFSALVIAALDRHTIRGHRAWISDVPGMPAGLAVRLGEQGLHFPADLVRADETGRLPPLPGIPREQVAAWLAAARLMEVRGLGARGLAWLHAAGVRSVEDLARSDPAALHAALPAQGPGPVPSRAEIAVWVRGARERAP